MEIWIARDDDGDIYMYNRKPIYCDHTYHIIDDCNGSTCTLINSVPFELNPGECKHFVLKEDIPNT